MARSLFPAAIALTICAAPVISRSRQLSALEAAIIAEHNLARTNPQTYAQLLQQRLGLFDGRLLRLPGRIPLMTNEGPSAVSEAIEFLEGHQAIPELTHASGMSAGADDHVKDQGPRGEFGHTGTDGSQPWDRISRYGAWTGTAAENIAYGPSSGREVVLQLIIDDGVTNRGHRHNIFNAAFRAIGVACGPHQEFEIMCVITYAQGYTTRSPSRAPD